MKIPPVIVRRFAPCGMPERLHQMQIEMDQLHDRHGELQKSVRIERDFKRNQFGGLFDWEPRR